MLAPDDSDPNLERDPPKLYLHDDPQPEEPHLTSPRLNEGPAVDADGAHSRPGLTAFDRLERRGLATAKLLVWSLVALWAVSSLWYPFDWDQGIFAWVGDTILSGGMPYRDAFDLKAPAAHVIFAMAQAVFGRNQWGIRVVDLVGIGVSAWLVAKVVRHYTAPGIGQWSPALLVVWFGGLTFWHTAQPDGFAAMLFCAGFLPLFGKDPRMGPRRRRGPGRRRRHRDEAELYGVPPRAGRNLLRPIDRSSEASCGPTRRRYRVGRPDRDSRRHRPARGPDRRPHRSRAA